MTATLRDAVDESPFVIRAEHALGSRQQAESAERRQPGRAASQEIAAVQFFCL